MSLGAKFENLSGAIDLGLEAGDLLQLGIGGQVPRECNSLNDMLRETPSTAEAYLPMLALEEPQNKEKLYDRITGPEMKGGYRVSEYMFDDRPVYREKSNQIETVKEWVGDNGQTDASITQLYNPDGSISDQTTKFIFAGEAVRIHRSTPNGAPDEVKLGSEIMKDKNQIEVLLQREKELLKPLQKVNLRDAQEPEQGGPPKSQK